MSPLRRLIFVIFLTFHNFEVDLVVLNSDLRLGQEVGQEFSFHTSALIVTAALECSIKKKLFTLYLDYTWSHCHIDRAIENLPYQLYHVE